MPGSLFDDSFQTAIPQLDTKSIWAASILRNNALDFTPITNSFKEIGKVFTDAEDNLKKYNTASLTSYLDTMPWEARLRLQKKGINPAMFLAREGIPVDIANKELSKAYKDSYDNARQNYTADWIAKTLPSIPYQDWVSYMMGEKPDLFDNLDSNADLVNNKDFRDALTSRMQSAANQFLISFDADHGITPQRAIAERKTIDQLRWEEANDAERSVLQHATNQFTNDLQTTTTNWSDKYREDYIANLPARDKTNLSPDDSYTQFPNSSANSSRSYKEAAALALPELARRYYEWSAKTEDPRRISMEFPNWVDALEDDDEIFAMFNGDQGRIQAFKNDLIEAAKTFKYDNHTNYRQGDLLPTYEDEDDLGYYYDRLMKTHPDKAKAMLEDTVKKKRTQYEQWLKTSNNPEIVKMREALNNPGVNKEVVQGYLNTELEKARAQYANPESWELNNVVIPAITRFFNESNVRAVHNAAGEAAQREDNYKIAVKKLNDNPIVRAMAGQGRSGSDLFSSKEALAALEPVKEELYEILPDKAKQRIAQYSLAERNMVFMGALGLITNGNYQQYRSMKAQDAKKAVLEFKGQNRLVNSAEFNELLEIIEAIHESGGWRSKTRDEEQQGANQGTKTN